MGVTSVLEINIEFLFNRLLIQSIRIDNIHAFWESVGFTINNDPHVISLIQKHPLLNVKTVYKGKTVSERLLEELGMFKELISSDKQTQIEWLLRLLQSERNRIGFTVVDDPQMISLIKNHPLLTAKTEHQGKAVLERLIDELGFKELISDDHSLQIDWLLCRLRSEKNCIENKNLFWQRIGFTVTDDPQMISLIKNHPLLTAKTVYKGKALLERLIDELGFKELISDDHSLQIDWLLCRLRSEKNCIENKNLFWQRIGFTVTDDPQMISLIKNHPLLTAKTEHQGKAVLERLIDELGFKELISDDHSLQIDWLLCRLRSEKNCIENKNLFWQRIGFTVADDPQMISLIKTHPLLVETTQYKTLTVVRRLIEELEMYCFAEQYWNHLTRFTDNLYITHSGTIALKDMSDDDSAIPLFMFTTNTNSSEDEYCFDDTHSFNLSIVTVNMNHAIQIYARPKNGSFPFHHIKAIKNDKWLTKYILKRDKPLDIIENINIEPLDEEYGQNGRIHIRCNSDIIIHKAAQINANGCGMNKEMSLFHRKYNAQKNEEQIHLKYGTFADSSHEEKTDCEDAGNECGGGVIELISPSNIVNNGTLTSNATNADYLGGTICIK
eukprot:283037_1